MKLCISSKGSSLDSDVDPRFGRCHSFLFVDTESMGCHELSNASIAASSGAGIQAAQRIARMGAEIVITGNIGPNAFETLKAANIVVITGFSGTIREAVDAYKKGELTESSQASVGSHHGMRSGGTQ